jgi:hypothetical protein
LELPYNISNLKTITTGDYIFIDKTNFIPLLEKKSRYTSFFRPRRFGKSLIISMLEHYYDISHEKEYENIFGDTWIGAHPTDEKNSYGVLKIDFSGVGSDLGNLYEAFSHKIELSMKQFILRYNITPSIDINWSQPPSAFAFEFFVSMQHDFKHPIYFITDEYDIFANELIGSNLAEFASIMSAKGYIRKFYEVIKQCAGDGIIGRIYMSGVAPLALDSLTSGFNICRNISMNPVFHDMAGFTPDEARRLTNEALGGLDIDLEDEYHNMERLYDGYKFHPNSPHRI